MRSKVSCSPPYLCTRCFEHPFRQSQAVHFKFHLLSRYGTTLQFEPETHFLVSADGLSAL